MKLTTIHSLVDHNTYGKKSNIVLLLYQEKVLLFIKLFLDHKTFGSLTEIETFDCYRVTV